MARGYGVGNFGDAYYGVTKYVDGEAAASVSASVTSNATATFSSGDPQTIAATLSITADMVRVKSVESIVESSSVIVSNAETVVTSSALITSTSTGSVSYIRIRLVDAIMAVQCSATASAREKWEPIAVTPETWTPLADTAEIWTEVA